MRKFNRAACWSAGAALLFSGMLNAGGVHYKINASSIFYAADAAQLAGVRMNWLYDAEVSAFILEGRDTSAAGLQQVADDMILDLHELGYFAVFTLDGQALPLKKVSDYSIRLTNDKRLQLGIQLALQQATDVSGKTVALTLSDPYSTADIVYSGVERIALEEGLASCGKPDLQSKEVTANEHELTIQTVSLNCQ